ncbi:hypothetical protein D3C87_363040 [compost metagenome]
MSNPAFIVDGFTEKNIIDRICPRKPIRRTDLNGRDVTLDAIAERLAMHIRLLSNNYYPIIIIIDKETRDISTQEMAEYLLCKLEELGVKNQDIRISVADRMIENWLVGDKSIFNADDKLPENTDGLNGASILRKKFGTYSKATDCLKLINSFNAKEAYANSPSFKEFIDKIDDLECYLAKAAKE